MRFDRNVVVLLIAVLVVVGALSWRISQTERSAPPDTAPSLPTLHVEPRESIDEFLAQFENDAFKSVGLVRADAFEDELVLGWNRKWTELPDHYRRETVSRIGAAWNLYYGGITRVYAVPNGAELARYSPPPAKSR